MLDSVDWAKPSRYYLALVFQGFVSFIVCDKALDYIKTRSLVADSFIIGNNMEYSGNLSVLMFMLILLISIPAFEIWLWRKYPIKKMDAEYTNGLNKKSRTKLRIFYYIALLLMFVSAG